MRQMTIDNRPPADTAYPHTRPVLFNDKRRFIVHPGDYVVESDGAIMIVTTSNDGPYCNDFVRGLTEPYYRAKYIGNADDGLYLVSWSRPATPAEAARAKNYHQQGVLL